MNSMFDYYMKEVNEAEDKAFGAETEQDQISALMQWLSKVSKALGCLGCLEGGEK